MDDETSVEHVCMTQFLRPIDRARPKPPEGRLIPDFPEIEIFCVLIEYPADQDRVALSVVTVASDVETTV